MDLLETLKQLHTKKCEYAEDHRKIEKQIVNILNDFLLKSKYNYTPEKIITDLNAFLEIRHCRARGSDLLFLAIDGNMIELTKLLATVPELNQSRNNYTEDEGKRYVEYAMDLAVDLNRVEIVADLVSKKFNYSQSALMLAVKNSSIPIIKLLCGVEDHIEEWRCDDGCPLIAAITNNDHAVVKFLMENFVCSEWTCEYEYRSYLKEAAALKDTTIFRYICSLTELTNVTCAFGAIVDNLNVSALRILFEYNVNENKTNTAEVTMLEQIDIYKRLDPFNGDVLDQMREIVVEYINKKHSLLEPLYLPIIKLIYSY